MNEQIEALLGAVEPLTDQEFEAVTDWIRATKDELPWTLKEGLLKLINAETRRRL